MSGEPPVWTEAEEQWHPGDKCCVCGEPMKIGQRFWLNNPLAEQPWHADHRRPDGTISKEPIREGA